MFVMGMAYRGTANNGAIQKLLHFAVSDVSDDVRRAAVLNLGFLLMGVPDQCPPIVALLSESYNPHVRYGESNHGVLLLHRCVDLSRSHGAAWPAPFQLNTSLLHCRSADVLREGFTI